MAEIVPIGGHGHLPAAPLNDGGGGGTFGGMEARVAQLEKDMSEVKSDVKTLLVDTAEIKGRLAHAPTYPGLFAMCGALVAVIGAVVAILVRFLPAAH